MLKWKWQFYSWPIEVFKDSINIESKLIQIDIRLNE